MKKSYVSLAAPVALAMSAIAAAQSPAPPPVDLESANPLSGTWVYRPAAGGTEAAFRDYGGADRLVIRCSRPTRQVSLIRDLSAASPTMVVWTTSVARSLPARHEPATNTLITTVPAGDVILDAIVYSRGRFAVASSGAAALVVPSWPEAARVVEDCRN